MQTAQSSGHRAEKFKGNGLCCKPGFGTQFLKCWYIGQWIPAADNKGFRLFHYLLRNQYICIKMILMYLEKFKEEIRLLCEKNKVKNLFVFGSVLSERFNESSDIDLIVDIDSADPLEYADYYFNLKFALEDLLKRQIDLLENKAISNPYLRESIDKSKTLLYAA